MKVKVLLKLEEVRSKRVAVREQTEVTGRAKQSSIRSLRRRV